MLNKEMLLEKDIKKLESLGILIWNPQGCFYAINPLIENNLIFNANVSLGFEDVAIKQKKNKCKSRLDVDISSEFVKGIKLKTPLIASNMSTVTNADFCIALYKAGAIGVMHRALEEEPYLKEIKKIAKNCDIVCSSVGVGSSQFELAKKLIHAGSNVIFIDIAHGYSDPVIDIGRKIKNFSKETKVVVGNTVAVEMIYEVADFASATKVGIACGKSCETKDTAGCTEGQFSAVLKFREASKQTGIPIISDGGIRKPSDFVKAMGAGSGAVMAGSIFAMCPESAAETVIFEGKEKKLFAGMASRFVQNRWKGGLKQGTCTEGKVVHLDIGESCEKLIERYGGALKSGITYAGCKNVEEFKQNCEFVRLK